VIDSAPCSIYRGIAEASEHQPTVNSLGSLSDTIDKIKSAVAGQIDVGVMRADLSDHYLPAKPNVCHYIYLRNLMYVTIFTC